MTTYRVYLRSHAPDEVGRILERIEPTRDPGVAESAYRRLLARGDLIGQRVAAVMSSNRPSGGGSGSAIYFSRFDRDLCDGRIHPEAPLDLYRADDGTGEATRWLPPTARPQDWETDPRPLADCLKAWHGQPGRSRQWAAEVLGLSLATYNGYCAGRKAVEGPIRKLMTRIDAERATCSMG